MFVHLKGDPAMPFNEIIYRILTEAVIPGVGSILSFIPTIALMIFVFALLRESGIVRGDALSHGLQLLRPRHLIVQRDPR